MCIQLVHSESNKSNMFFLQWHITSKCDQNCKHCYMYDSPFYESEKENELTTLECFAIIDDYKNTIELAGTEGGIVFTGGDPLLRNDFFELLKYAKNKGINFLSVVGNSYHVNKESAEKLKEFGVNFYQISLDGLKETHDKFRKSGSFEDAIRAYKVLKDVGINTGCMLTVSKQNMNELIDVIRLVSDIGVTAFDFDRLVQLGNGKTLINSTIDANSYKELLLKVKEEYERLSNLGSKTIFGYKDNLWSLILKEENYLKEIIPKGYEVKRSCLIGEGAFAILADGSVLACRRLPIKIGKLPNDTLLNIHNHSTELKNLTNFNKPVSCNSCKDTCMSTTCRAVAYGYSGGDYFAKDPQCWKN